MKTQTVFKQSFWLGIVPALLLFCSARLNGQQQGFWNAGLEAIAKPTSKQGWYDIKEELEIYPEELFQLHKTAFHLGSADEMRLKKIQNGQSGRKHYRFEQYHKGVRVSGPQFSVHTKKNGKVYLVNGNVLSDVDLNPKPSVSEIQAFGAIGRLVDLQNGLWNSPQEEKLLKERAQLPEATYYPKGELVFRLLRSTKSRKAKKVQLCWAFEIHLQYPGVSKMMFIDAKTGQLFDSFPLAMECEAATTETSWYGNRNISVSRLDADFQLLDDCTGSHPYTIRTRRVLNSGDLEAITSTNNDFSNTNMEIAGGTAHWGAHRTADYFDEVHSHSSWNDSGANIEIVIDRDYCNGRWDGQRITLGMCDVSSTTDDLTPLDIVGHEFTHGVVGATAGLEYKDESGALNESFADIFGEIVEHYTLGDLDWLVAGDRGAFRSLSNPSDYNDPDTYKGDNWYDGDDDNGGVHTNSGVQNYWFYLLCEGGSGINDDGDVYKVKGIGINKARRIVYEALLLLNPQDEYMDARRASLRAARTEFGACSFEEIQVGKAWFAVNVGDELPRSDYKICGTETEGFFQGINAVIGGGSCTTAVNATDGNVTFAAGNEIILKPGFGATASGERRFLAYLEPCSFTVWSSSTTLADQPHDQQLEAEVHNALNIPLVESADDHLPLGNLDLKVAPNPFSSDAMIRFHLDRESSVSLEIYNTDGALIQRILDNRHHESGSYQVQFDGSHLPGGIYFCRLTSTSDSETVRMVIE